jgi:hypothetical protein
MSEPTNEQRETQRTLEAYRPEVEAILRALGFPSGWDRLSDATTIGQLVEAAGRDWRSGRDALHAAGFYSCVADNTTHEPVWRIAQCRREDEEDVAAYWREQEALLEDTRPMDPAPEDPTGGGNDGCWPEGRPFPLTPEESQRLLMGYAVPWRGTIGEWHRWQAHGVELWGGWARIKR